MMSNVSLDASPSPKLFRCPLCAEVGAHGLRSIGSTGTSRLYDLGRHLRNYHPCNVQFRCPVEGCEAVFKWKQAWEDHHKSEHGKIGTNTIATQEDYHQLVFACGFKDCEKIFEASGIDDAEKQRLSYFNHMSNHCKPRMDDYTPDDWSHSRVIRNLMRQRCLKGKIKGKDLPEDLEWEQPRSAELLRMLETRTVPDDIESFTSMAIELSTNPGINRPAGRTERSTLIAGFVGDKDLGALQMFHAQDGTVPDANLSMYDNFGLFSEPGQGDTSMSTHSFHPQDHGFLPSANHIQTSPWMNGNSSLSVSKLSTTGLGGSYIPSPISPSASSFGHASYSNYTLPGNQPVETGGYDMSDFHRWDVEHPPPEHQQAELPVSHQSYYDATGSSDINGHQNPHE
ncbi:hypothetical protein QBC38DRAFT_265354 [Podospora fimiseda]|uniref:C2H2-type domain-containing protein n=1 Tax=Podospora fimiseda TaxID=252190 RepID=A0AAN7BLA2_9PEZI|nr:hypothetical protein QBC38DRAFT_265354 [Podospora fimiseda]